MTVPVAVRIAFIIAPFLAERDLRTRKLKQNDYGFSRYTRNHNLDQ